MRSTEQTKDGHGLKAIRPRQRQMLRQELEERLIAAEKVVDAALGPMAISHPFFESRTRLAREYRERYPQGQVGTSGAWIDCSDKEPDTTGCYLVTCLGGTIDIGFFSGKRWLDKTGNTAIVVIAWRDLPAAYSRKYAEAE